jgi:hypothetical protein
MNELLRVRTLICTLGLVGSLSIGTTPMADAAGRHSAQVRIQALLGAQSAAVHVEHLSRTDESSKHVEIFLDAAAGGGPLASHSFLHGHQDGTTTPGGKAFADYGVLDDARHEDTWACFPKYPRSFCGG